LSEDKSSMVDNTDVQQIAQELDLAGALKRVLKAASYRDGLAKGLHEVCKAIDNAKKPIACILADNCDEPQYKKLVEALCKENDVPLIRIKDGKTLGEWVGLCKYDAMMNPRKVRRCSSCVIREFAIEDEATKLVSEAIAGKKEIRLD